MFPKSLLVLAVVCLSTISRSLFAQVSSFTVNGRTCYGSKNLPIEILGTYEYEHFGRYGEPKIVLKSNGTGSFQPHKRPSIDIEIWVETDKNGNIFIDGPGPTGNYQYFVIAQFRNSSNPAYPTGAYRRWNCVIDKQEGVGVLLGERFNRTPNIPAITPRNTAVFSGDEAGGDIVNIPKEIDAATAASLADIYKKKMNSDPANAQAWAFCAAAALARANYQKEEAELYLKKTAMMLKRINSKSSDCPCSDVIPQEIWENENK